MFMIWAVWTLIKNPLQKKANELCLMTSFEWNNYR